MPQEPRVPVPRTRHPVLLTFLHTHITRSARHIAVGFVDYEVGAALCRRPTTLSGKRKLALWSPGASAETLLPAGDPLLLDAPRAALVPGALA